MPLPFDAKPSDEFGDRRQDAANDHGSERSSKYHLSVIRDFIEAGEVSGAIKYLDMLRSGVSARSADISPILRAAKRVVVFHDKGQLANGKHDSRAVESLREAIKELESTQPGPG